MRAYRLARRSKAIRGFSQQVLRANSVAAISRLCADMFRRFGGPAGFCRAWKAQIDAAPAGSRTALSSFRAITKLLEVSEAQQQPPDYLALTDTELDAAIDRELQRFLDDRGDFS